MSVRMRHTSSHTKNRRSHHALAASKTVKDKESGALRLPHRLDETTGMYRGKLIVPEQKSRLKKEAKRKANNEEERHDHDVSGTREPIHAEEKALKPSDAAVKKQRTKARSATGS